MSESDGNTGDVEEGEAVGFEEVGGGDGDGTFSEDVVETALVSLIDEEGFSGGDGATVGTFENALGF